MSEKLTVVIIRKSFAHGKKNMMLIELSGKNFTDLSLGFNSLQDVLPWAYMPNPDQCNCYRKGEVVGKALCMENVSQDQWDGLMALND